MASFAILAVGLTLVMTGAAATILAYGASLVTTVASAATTAISTGLTFAWGSITSLGSYISMFGKIILSDTIFLLI